MYCLVKPSCPSSVAGGSRVRRLNCYDLIDWCLGTSMCSLPSNTIRVVLSSYFIFTILIYSADPMDIMIMLFLYLGIDGYRYRFIYTYRLYYSFSFLKSLPYL